MALTFDAEHPDRPHHGDTQTAELKSLIEKAKPTIQKHLDKAEALQKKLEKATT